MAFVLLFYIYNTISKPNTRQRNTDVIKLMANALYATFMKQVEGLFWVNQTFVIAYRDVKLEFNFSQSFAIDEMYSQLEMEY